MGIFGAVAGARATEGGRYFEPDGEYVVQIQACKHGKTRKGVDFFVVECRVVESNISKLPPKAECSWMVTMDKDAAPGNINAFICAATDCAPDDVDEAGVLAIVGKDQPLAGDLIRTSTFNKPTKAGNPFTRHVWKALTPDERKRYAGMVAELNMQIKK